MSPRLMIRQLTIKYTETNNTRPLIKSYGTWSHIKHSATKNYHLEEKQLDTSGF